jgi:hypothetical protein
MMAIMLDNNIARGRSIRISPSGRHARAADGARPIDVAILAESSGKMMKVERRIPPQ